MSGWPSGSVAASGAGVPPSGTVCAVFPGAASSKAGAWFGAAGTVMTSVVVSVPPAGSVTVMTTGYVPGAVGAPVKVPSGLSVTPGGRSAGSAVKTSGRPSGSVAVTGATGVPSGTVWASFSGTGSKAGSRSGRAGTVMTTVVVSVRPPGSVTVMTTG